MNWPFSDITPGHLARWARTGRWDKLRAAARYAARVNRKAMAPERLKLVKNPDTDYQTIILLTDEIHDERRQAVVAKLIADDMALVAKSRILNTLKQRFGTVHGNPPADALVKELIVPINEPQGKAHTPAELQNLLDLCLRNLLRARTEGPKPTLDPHTQPLLPDPRTRAVLHLYMHPGHTVLVHKFGRASALLLFPEGTGPTPEQASQLEAEMRYRFGTLDTPSVFARPSGDGRTQLTISFDHPSDAHRIHTITEEAVKRFAPGSSTEDN